jgi:hypothetical protein
MTGGALSALSERQVHSLPLINKFCAKILSRAGMIKNGFGGDFIAFGAN